MQDDLILACVCVCVCVFVVFMCLRELYDLTRNLEKIDGFSVGFGMIL